MALIYNTLMSQYPEEYSMLIAVIGTPSDSTLTTDQIDYLLYMAIDRAAKAIMKYTGWTEIQSGYESVVCSLTLAYLNADTQTARLFIGKPFISAQTQGSRSATYKADMPTIDGDGLTAEVKAALPLPVLKVY